MWGGGGGIGTECIESGKWDSWEKGNLTIRMKGVQGVGEGVCMAWEQDISFVSLAKKRETVVCGWWTCVVV